MCIGFHAKYPLLLSDFNELEFSRLMFKKYSTGSRVVTRGEKDGRADGRTDRHDEANSCFSQFCERAYNTYFKKDVLTSTGLDEIKIHW